MNAIERRLRAAVNPLSTAISGWWCHSAVRHLLTGHGPPAKQRRLIRRAARQWRLIRLQAASAHPSQATRGAVPSAEEMKARAAAIDELLAQQDHQA